MNLADLAEEHNLHRVGGRPPFWTYIREAWKRRTFISTLAQYRLRASLDGNRLGIIWLVLQPVLSALVYGLVFGILQGDRRPPGFAAHVVVGVFLFQFFTKSLNMGAKSITGNYSLVQSLAFPRITLPIAEVIEQFLATLPSIGLLFIIMPMFGHWPTWRWLLIVPILALFTLFNTGVALISARLTVHLRDLTQLLPFISRLLFYTSGVLFDVNRIFDRFPVVVRLYDFHPLYQALQMTRAALMDGYAYKDLYWFTFSLWSIGTFLFGVIFFWAAEERYGRE